MTSIRRWRAVFAAALIVSICRAPAVCAQDTEKQDRSVLLQQPRRTVEENGGEEDVVSNIRLASLQEPVDVEELATGELIEGIEMPDGVGPTGSVYFEPQAGNFVRYWISGEYLLWRTKGMAVPPLVTTSPAGTPGMDAGVLGRPGTQILYGNGRILNGGSSDGYRVRLGTWFDPASRWGIGGEYFRILTVDEHFEASSDASGSPILARPFFNMNPRDGGGTLDPPAREDAEIIALPTVARGTVMVDSSTRLDSAAVYLVRSADPGCGGSDECCDPCGTRSAIQFRFGYRYARLREHLRITEDITSLDTGNPGQFAIYDHFQTENEFHGGELAVSWTGNYRRWSLEVLLQLAVGNNKQTVNIDGQTTFSAGAGSQFFPGGLLAQRTNIGTYERNVFAVIPQFGANLGFELWPGMRLTGGYSLFYWSREARPGQQIDLDVNPDLLPPEQVPFVGPLRPQFVFRDGDYWAHGLTAGIDYRW